MMLVLAGCTRDPAEELCPPSSAGDLVVSEVRGPQSPADVLVGPWIELFNASGQPIDLLGIRIRFHDAQGNEDVVMVRRTVSVVAAGYAVLGMADDRALPPKVDYGFVQDFHDNPFPSGVTGVDVYSCATLVDKITYDSLPSTGTYSLGGTPNADANDLETRWCTNPSAAGTPQAPNISCP
jgi:hypothetical protein